ncbi:MAG: MmgE/PrpD family protein [Deltaproteobacteria bacterium]|nr:MmgE/PrpD family protein [Deltaproteobacteria bacterium]
MKTIANRLAELVTAIRFESLPQEVIRETKRRVLDALGCALGGFQGEPSAIMRSVAADLGGQPQSTIWGSGRQTSCDRATLINSTMLRYLDYMDSHAGSDACHPCFNVPACVAVAERAGASGQALIAAIVAGYEVQIRYQEACKIGSRGWFGGTYLEFSVPLAVGKLLGLDVEQLTNAVGIAASHANSLNAVSVGSIPASKSVADGMVASTGVMAALMARSGLTGPTDVIESPGGFEKSVAGRIDYERLLAPLGHYKIMEVNTKWFNTVRTAQTAVTSAFGLLEKHGLAWRDVEAITIFLPTGEHVGHDGIWNSVSRLRPQTRDSANHSVVFSLAAALVDGELGPAQYADAKLSDPDILSLVDRTTLRPDSSLDRHWPEAAVSRVVLKTNRGQNYEATTLYPPGHHKNRVTAEQMQQKFARLASQVLNQQQSDAVIQAVDRLDELKSVKELTLQLTGEV